MKQVDVAETLIEEADAIGADLTFDLDGKRVKRADPPADDESDND